MMSLIHGVARTTKHLRSNPSKRRSSKSKRCLLILLNIFWGIENLWGVYFSPLQSLLFPVLLARSLDFPMGTGRAHDTALLCKWLGWELSKLDDYDVVLWRVLCIFFWQQIYDGYGYNTIQAGTIKQLPKNIAIGNWNGIAPEHVFKNIYCSLGKICAIYG